MPGSSTSEMQGLRRDDRHPGRLPAWPDSRSPRRSTTIVIDGGAPLINWASVLFNPERCTHIGALVKSMRPINGRQFGNVG
jgi:hypothetical protein